MPNQEDPLVGLRKEELDIKAADVDRKASEGSSELISKEEELIIRKTSVMRG